MAANDKVNRSFDRKEYDNCFRLYHESLDKIYSGATPLNPKYCNASNKSHRSDEDRAIDIVREARCNEKLQNSSSGAEVRYINPAIYAESISAENEDVEETANIVGLRVGRRSETKILDDGGDTGSTRKVAADAAAPAAPAADMMLSSLSLKEALVPSKGDFAAGEIASPETYRCYFSTSSATSSIDKSSGRHFESIVNVKPVSRRVERRCRITDKTSCDGHGSSSNGLDVDDGQKNNPPVIQRYVINGHRVVHMSTAASSAASSAAAAAVASSSSSSSSSSSIGTAKSPRLLSEESPLARKSAHEEWLRKKQTYLQRKREEEETMERKKREVEERLAREREEKERMERENFVRWAERKRKEEAEKRAALEKEMEIEKRLKEFEEKAVIAKALCLRQWARKKEDEKKAQQKAQQLKEEQDEEERKRRQEESSKAYEEWRERSKNRPKPATQGLLPHQAAKPAFVNPTPWRKLIDEDSDDGQGDGVKRTKVKGKIKNRNKTST